MPYQFSTRTLPCGASYLHVEGIGVIAKEDAELMMKLDVPGRPEYGMPSLVLTQRMTTITPEARAIFSGLKARFWCAVVVTNPVIRVLTNFLGRVLRRSGQSKMFGTEEAALRWLNERVSEEGRPPPP